jgi:MFS family permease
MSRSFHLYLTARFAASVAMTTLRAAITWQVYDLSGSEAMLGLIGLTQFVPAVLFSLAGGVAADRFSRDRIVRRAQWAATLCGPLLMGLAAVVAPGVLWPWFLTVAIVAALASFEQPSRSALLVSLVTREQLPRALTQAATVQALAFATGPVFAGLLIANVHAMAPFVTHAVLMILSSVVVSLMKFEVAPAGSTMSPIQSLVEGFRYVRNNPVVFGCMFLDMIAVVLGGATALLPVYAKDILAVGADGYGWLAASLDIGALATSFYLIARRPLESPGRALILSVIGYGVATFVFGLSRSLPLSLAAYALVGAFDQVSVVMRHTTVQLTTPDEMRGRVSSINTIFIITSNQLGAFESGMLAAATSAPFAVCFGGVGAVLAALGVAWWIPELRNYRVEPEAAKR